MPPANNIRDRPAAPTYSRNKSYRSDEIRDMPNAPRHPAFVLQTKTYAAPKPDVIRELSPEEVSALRTPSGLTVKCCRSRRLKFKCIQLDAGADGFECWRYDEKLRTKTTRWCNGAETYVMRCAECLRKEGTIE